jgi:DNA-directed RNA polymerase subunit RPC12/RpoP
MIANTKCQHCGNEFETDGTNKSEFCPHCGKETFIFGQVAVPAPASITGGSSTAATLKQIRQQTCYKTLRGLIDLVQILIFVAVGLAVLGAFGGLFFPDSETPAAGKFLTLIIGAASAFILIVLAIAWKQAALLLVDIADCQIRLAGNKISN